MLYCCGSNGQGQLGLGHDEDLDRFVPCLDLESPPKLSAGGNHTLLLDGGRAFLSGKVGQFDSQKFIQLEGPPNEANLDGAEGNPVWTHCASGWDFYLLATTTQVYFYGNHQLVSSSEPKLLGNFGSPIRDVVCGMAHAIVVLENGCLYGFGLGRQGQLSHVQSSATFELLSQRGDQVACGRDFSVVLHRGRAQGLGKRVQNLDAPATKVFAGWTFWGVEQDAKIKWSGNNAFGQLEAPQTTFVAVGSEHGLAFENNKVITWGWGEHGNCPPPVEVSLASPSVSPSASLALAPVLYGGCATSWFWSA